VGFLWQEGEEEKKEQVGTIASQKKSSGITEKCLIYALLENATHCRRTMSISS
jgi:hypothetical protein